MLSRIRPQFIDDFGEAIIDEFHTKRAILIVAHYFATETIVVLLEAREDILRADHVIAGFDVEQLFVRNFIFLK